MPADGRDDAPIGPAEARGLAAQRQWRVLAERTRTLDTETLLAEPELGYHCANAWMHTGAADAALGLAEQLEPGILGSGNRRLTLQLVNLLGVLLFEAGRTAEAELRWGDLLERATDWNDDGFSARASNNLGVLANLRGDRDSALNYYQRALAAHQRLGYIRGLAQTHYNLGLSYRELGFADEAGTHYDHAVRYALQAESEDVIALAESDRGLLCVQMGDPRKGEAFARRARRRFERIGDPVRAAESIRVLAAAGLALGRPEAARRLLDDALRTARGHTNLLLLAEIQRDRGLLLRRLGEPEAAREALLDSAEHFARLGALAARDELLRLVDAPLA